MVPNTRRASSPIFLDQDTSAGEAGKGEGSEEETTGGYSTATFTGTSESLPILSS